MKATIKFNGKEYDAVLIEKKVESKRWKPELGEYYYFVDMFGCIDSSSWDNDAVDKVDNFRYSQRNVFKTEEEAEKHLEYLKSLAILRDDAGDWKPDWKNTRQEKYRIYFDCYVDKLFVSSTKAYRSINELHFETEESAQKSIDEHKEHWLRVLGVDNG